MKYLILGDLHENEKLLDEAIGKLDDSTKIIFLGDLFHPHNSDKKRGDEKAIDLTFKVRHLMRKGKLIWVCGNHDYIQFLVSYAIMHNKKHVYDYEHEKYDPKDYIHDNNWYIGKSIKQYYDHPHSQGAFVRMFLRGEICFNYQLGDKVFCHSCIFEGSPIKNNDEFVEKWKRDIAIINKNEKLFDFSGATKGVWYHLNKNIKYSSKDGYYYLRKGILIHKENYVGHSSLLSIHAGVDKGSLRDTKYVKDLNKAISKNFIELSHFNMCYNKEIYAVDTTGMTDYHKKWLIIEA